MDSLKVSPPKYLLIAMVVFINVHRFYFYFFLQELKSTPLEYVLDLVTYFQRVEYEGKSDNFTLEKLADTTLTT